jgi:hypothetical protein
LHTVQYTVLPVNYPLDLNLTRLYPLIISFTLLMMYSIVVRALTLSKLVQYYLLYIKIVCREYMIYLSNKYLFRKISRKSWTYMYCFAVLTQYPKWYEHFHGRAGTAEENPKDVYNCLCLFFSRTVKQFMGQNCFWSVNCHLIYH